MDCPKCETRLRVYRVRQLAFDYKVRELRCRKCGWRGESGERIQRALARVK